MALNYEENLEAFTITFRREIVFYLRQLVNDGDRVSVMFDGGRETLLTVLLDVDEEAGQVYFDWGGSETISRKLIDSDRIYFIASPHGVRNQFMTTRVAEATFKGQRAFATPIPSKYARLQRREFFRLHLPMTQRRPCRFKVGEPAVDFEMAVVDIGIGGVALEGAVVVAPFEIGQVIPKARIDLGKSGVIVTDIEVRSSATISRGRTEVGRLGCQFVKLTQSYETELQRFITNVQREERAKLG